MSSPPVDPKIYHITHVDNLQSIIGDGVVHSDAAMIMRGGSVQGIGMSSIKLRRLTLPVECHPGTKVGEYVPFYFCPRSVMLYVIHCANHPELSYKGGQSSIIHLRADLYKVIDWAESVDRNWAFSCSNAGARYTQFYSAPDNLNLIDWHAIASTQFSLPEVKETKQAEFLLYESFPWALFDDIGVYSNRIKMEVEQIIIPTSHKPMVTIKPNWYY